jgi:hypothetical protein
MDLPVNPMRRFEHYVELADELPPMPLIKDPDRLVIRPEGKGYSVGWSVRRAARFQLRDRAGLVPGRRLARVRRAHSRVRGAQAQARMGGALRRVRAGRQHDPRQLAGAARQLLRRVRLLRPRPHARAGGGRALAELIVKGRFETIDLTRMGYQRVLDNAPYPETGII